MGRQTYRDSLAGPKRAPTLEWSEAAQYGIARIGVRARSESPSPQAQEAEAGSPPGTPDLRELVSEGIAKSGHFPLLFFKDTRYNAARGGPGGGLSASASAPLLSILRVAAGASSVHAKKSVHGFASEPSSRHESSRHPDQSARGHPEPTARGHPEPTARRQSLGASARRPSFAAISSRRTARTARIGSREEAEGDAALAAAKAGAGLQLAHKFADLEKKLAQAAAKQLRKKATAGRRLHVTRRRDSHPGAADASPSPPPPVPGLTPGLLGALAGERPGTHDRAPSLSTARSAVSQGGALGGGVLAPIPAELRTLLLPKRLFAAASTTPSQRLGAAPDGGPDVAALMPKRKLTVTRALWLEYWRATGQAGPSAAARRIRAILDEAGVPPASAALPSARSSSRQLAAPGSAPPPSSAILAGSPPPGAGAGASPPAPASRASFIKRSKNASAVFGSRANLAPPSPDKAPAAAPAAPPPLPLPAPAEDHTAALSAARGALEAIVERLTEAQLVLLRPATPTPRPVPRAVDIDSGSGWQAYCEACAALETRALGAVEEAARSPQLLLAHRALLARGASAVALFLQQNRYVTRLDLRDNGIESSAAVALGTALATNQTVTHLDLSSNRPGLAGVAAICAALATNEGEVHTLRLARCGLGDREAAVAAIALEQNFTLTRLDLSRNAVGDRGALALARALILNEVLTSVDLTWNCLRTKAGNALGTALSKNEVLQELRLACNGLGGSGVCAIGRALASNAACALRVLDLTQCALDDDAAAALAAGVRACGTLERVCVGGNGEVTDAGAAPLVDALAGHGAIREVGLHGVIVAFGPPEGSEPALLSVAAVPHGALGEVPPGACDGMRAWELDAVQRMRARPLPVPPPPPPPAKPRTA